MAQQIGKVSAAVNDVREISPGTVAIGAGASVTRNEVIRTGAASSARIVFSDNTHLSMSANATAKMDASVYSGDGGGARAISARLSAGAFHFVTGNGPKRAYKLETPLATVGVRGTILDFLIRRGREVISLREGAARVCVKSTKKCLDLRAGQSVVITATGAGATIRYADNQGGDGGSRFADNAPADGRGRDAGLLDALFPSADANGADKLCGR
jgi:hypothetical protein